MDRDEAERILKNLQESLRGLTEKDPEQEVTGIAIRPLDAALSAIKEVFGTDDPVIQAVDDVISVETIEAGEAVRAADALIVVDILLGALPPQDWGEAYRR